MSNFEIPTYQTGILFESHNGELQYKTDLSIPIPNSNELLVNVKYSGVCHSDLHAYKGDWANPTLLPLIGGHEGIGYVVGYGSNVSGWSIGDIVGIKWSNYTCMNCEYCNSNFEQACDSLKSSGYTTMGTFQQYTKVDYRQATKIPKQAETSKKLPELAPILCGGLTSYSAIKSMKLGKNQWITIIGASGGLGSLAIQISKYLELKVIAIDGGESKESYVKELGADIYIDYLNTDCVVDSIMEITKGGSHGVINVSSSQIAMNLGFDYLRKRGIYCLVGMPPDSKFEYFTNKAIAKSITIIASSLGNSIETNELIQIALEGKIKCPIQIIGLSKLASVFELMEQGKINGRYVLDTYK